MVDLLHVQAKPLLEAAEAEKHRACHQGAVLGRFFFDEPGGFGAASGWHLKKNKKNGQPTETNVQTCVPSEEIWINPELLPKQLKSKDPTQSERFMFCLKTEDIKHVLTNQAELTRVGPTH